MMVYNGLCPLHTLKIFLLIAKARERVTPEGKVPPQGYTKGIRYM